MNKNDMRALLEGCHAYEDGGGNKFHHEISVLSTMAEVRRRTLEEAAMVAENQYGRNDSPSVSTGHLIAHAIRSLMERDQ